ncbi:MAG TPA: hypothetical protein VFV66_37690 [Nonomuraea sp.]|nr:hypothetical protein [Nonomuraea sp.]
MITRVAHRLMTIVLITSGILLTAGVATALAETSPTVPPGSLTVAPGSVEFVGGSSARYKDPSKSSGCPTPNHWGDCL